METPSKWMISLQVPQSYIMLQESVLRETERRRTASEPPVLLEDEMLELAKSNPENDILDHEELTQGTYNTLVQGATYLSSKTAN